MKLRTASKKALTSEIYRLRQVIAKGCELIEDMKYGTAIMWMEDNVKTSQHTTEGDESA